MLPYGVVEVIPYQFYINLSLLTRSEHLLNLMFLPRDVLKGVNFSYRLIFRSSVPTNAAQTQITQQQQQR
jgi:hypothetical protein